MIFGCLPQIWYAVEFLKRLGSDRPASFESDEESPLLQHSNPEAPSLSQSTLPSSDNSLEGIRLLVDTATTNFIFPPSPKKPIITTSDHSYGTINSYEQPSPSSPGHLAPPSPVRSISESSDSDFDSIISRDDFTGSGASSFSNEVVVEQLHPESASPLEEGLSGARLEWPEGSTQTFLPADAIQSLVTIESIEEQITWSNVRLPLGQSRRQVATRILRSAPKLFCILVLVQKAHCIISFLEDSVDDTDLPFIRDGKTRRSGNFRLCSKQHPNQPLKIMLPWTSKCIKDFSREQWSVMSPIFNGSGTIEHYEFDDNSVFPFTRDEERNHVKVGGFGTVWEVDIHPAHHSFHCKVLNPSFALKRLHSRSRSVFESEVEMLKLFSDRRRHDHLVKLLATYEFKGEFYLLFPWAKANLREYWKQTPVPQFSGFTVKWFLRQCKGIASGLLSIHGYQTTGDALEDLANIESSLDDTDPGCTHPDGRTYSRHGDIKPENILWSDEDTPDDEPHFNEEGILLISDFGLMKAYQDLTVFRQTPEQARGSAQYEPPEVAEPGAPKVVSRAYDIWSLGCVYLEFLTWLVGNFEGLEAFRNARSSGGDNETFFTLIDDGLPDHSCKAIVKQSVQEWIYRLHRMPRCSEFIHDFLDLITHHMLVTDPKERIHCGPLNEKLTDMVKRAERISKYLVPWGSSPAPKCGIEAVVSERNERQRPPNPMDGSPLPKRPSVARNPGAARKARPLSHTELQMLSQPSSPTSYKYFQGSVWYL